MVQALGLSVYAEVNVVATLVLLLPFLDLGTGAAVTNAVATGSREQVVDSLRTALRWVAVAAGAVVATAAAVILTVGWQPLLGLGTLGPEDSDRAVLVLALLVALNAPLALGQRALLGLHRNHVVGAMVAVQAVLALLATWMLTQLDAPPWLYVAPLPLAVVACSAVMFVRSCRLLGLRVGPLLAEAALPRRFPGTPIRATAAASLVITCGTALSQQTDRLLLSHAGTGEDLAQYVIAAQIHLPIWGLVTTAGLALWPVLRQRLHHDPDTARRLLHRYIGVFLALGATCAAAYVGVAPLLADLITGGAVELPAPLLWALAGLLLVQCVQFPSGMYLMGPRGLRAQAWLVVLAVTVNLPLSMALIPVAGAAGPVLGSVVAVVLVQLLPTYLLARSGRLTD
jgi:O-antigen/teichoic acid export membrane protein